MAVVECPTKAGWLSLSALRKQDGFRWVPYESRMAVVECSTKAGWLSFRALRKPFKKRVNRDNTEFRDKIAYVGGPSCRRRPWPVGERRSRVRATSATLVDIKRQLLPIHWSQHYIKCWDTQDCFLSILKLRISGQTMMALSQCPRTMSLYKTPSAIGRMRCHKDRCWLLIFR